VRLGKHATWATCGLVAASLVAAGGALDHLLGTRVAFALVGTALAALYLVGTFGASVPLFGPVARARRKPGCFALTFDDGPDPRYTREISLLLSARGHRATFFVLGVHARGHPELIVQLAEDGHELANHGDDHRLLAFSLPSTVRRQLAATEEAVEAADGVCARLFRAPHGVRSPWLERTLARSGYQACGWNGRIFDTANPGVETIVARVARMLSPGAVILLHDGDGSGHEESRRQTVDALPAILDEAERRGLRSVHLSSLLL
jgi:peptidoglycan/xylan/chitin deacetylase (PgdA/CDA1 family)